MAALTIFLSAALLFLVQPLLAKAILPWFGGAAAVWATALVFYQAALVLGYLYAHLLARAAPLRQAHIHIALLALSLAWLPVLPRAEWRPTDMDAPALAVLTLLAAAVAVPYILLAATSPLLQRWLARSGHTRPYRLYAVSNAGSLIGLLSYPFLLEPLLDLRAQAGAWSGGYIAFAVCCAWLAWSQRLAPAALDAGDVVPKPSVPRQAAWFTLSAIGAATLVAATNEIVMDIASVPLLWVVPLALYLVTMILAFAGKYQRLPWALLLGAALAAAAFRGDDLAFAEIWLQILFAAGAMFAAQMLCHGELARLAPAPRWLTRYYVLLAAGGATGGAAVAIVAPLVLPDYWEFPVLLLAALCALMFIMRHDPRPLVWVSLAVGVALGCVAVYQRTVSDGPTVSRSRNFFGVLRVTQDDDGGGLQRRLSHGRITHGTQLLDRPETPTTYYGPGSGIDLAMRTHPQRLRGRPLRIAAVGLGTGTIAALAEPGDSLMFLELNPAVVEVASRDFRYLALSTAHLAVRVGDGRLLLEQILERRGAAQLDVIVVDAFSSDAVPVHLLTVEAVRLYDQLLAPDGIILLHGTNRYLEFASLFRGLADVVDRHVVHVAQASAFDRGGYPNDWYLLVDDSARATRMRAAVGDSTSAKTEAARVWTDGFSNLLGILER